MHQAGTYTIKRRIDITPPLPFASLARLATEKQARDIGVAIPWLWAVDGIRPTTSDILGVAVCFVGMAIIMFGPRSGH